MNPLVTLLLSHATLAREWAKNLDALARELEEEARQKETQESPPDEIEQAPTSKAN